MFFLITVHSRECLQSEQSNKSRSGIRTFKSYQYGLLHEYWSSAAFPSNNKAIKSMLLMCKTTHSTCSTQEAVKKTNDNVWFIQKI